MTDAQLPYDARRRLRRATSSLRTGNPASAKTQLLSLCRDYPNSPDAWHYCAISLHLFGDNKSAESAFLRAADLAPNRPDYALDRARFFLETGNPDAALTAAASALSNESSSENAILLIASSYDQLHDTPNAISSLREYLRSHKNASRAWVQLTALLKKHGNTAQLLTILGEAFNFDQPDPVIGPLYAAALKQDNRHEQADKVCQTLISTASSPPEAWLELSHSALQRGRLGDARKFALEAISRNPHLGGAWYALAQANEPHPPEMPTVNANHESIFEFARGLFLDRRGQYEDAWRAYEKANEIAVLEHGGYDRRSQIQYVDDLIRHLDTGVVNNSTNSRRTHTTPIFICGVARSGTTLLEQMLASHPSGKVVAGGEMRIIHDLLLSSLGNFGLNQTGAYISRLTLHQREDLYTNWAKEIDARSKGAAYIVDKLPANSFLLGILHAAFPDAPIILVSRDPLAIACSTFITPFADGHRYSHTLDDISHYFSQYHRIVEYWFDLLPAGRILPVSYDDLVLNPRASLAQIMSRLRLDWDDLMLSFHLRSEPISTASLAQVRKPLNPAARTSWQRFASQMSPWKKALEKSYHEGAPP